MKFAWFDRAVSSSPQRLRMRIAILAAVAVAVTPSVSFAEPTDARFRLTERSGRSWLLDPNGDPFIVLGVNHIGAVARDRSRFAEQFNGRWDAFAKTLNTQFARWHMNCVGYGAPDELQDDYPYFATIGLAAIEKHRSNPNPDGPNGYAFPDVFDPAWQARIAEKIQSESRRHRGRATCIGYLWTDTPTWDLIKTRGLRGTDWVSEIRSLPADAPGRIRYVEFLSRRYDGRRTALNDYYSLNLGSLADLETADLSRVAIGRHVVQADDRDFLRLIAQTFYRVVGTAQRSADPTHLIFGDRYLVGDAPTEVLEEANPYIDALAVQPGDLYAPLYPPSTKFPGEELRRMHRITGKPILICDHAVSYPTAEHPRTIFEQAPNADAAAAVISDFADASFDEPYIIGYLKCQYIDRPSGFFRGLRQGLLHADGSERPKITAAYAASFSRANDALSHIVAGPTGSSPVRIIRNVWYASTDDPRQRLDLVVPTEPTTTGPLPVVALFHGGGWRKGERAGYLRRAQQFASTGRFAAATIGYRLSDQAKWPAQIHDAKAAIRWLRGNAEEHRLDPERIAAGGGSAGGHLAAMLGVSGGVQDLEGKLGDHRDQSSRVQFVLDRYGPTEFLSMNDAPGKMDHNVAESPESELIGGAIQLNPEAARSASPIHYVTPDDAPMLILHGAQDMSVPVDQSRRLASRLRAVGVSVDLVEYPESGHGLKRITGLFERELAALLEQFGR